MTIKQKIEIPVWLLTLIISGMVGLFTYSISFAGSYTAMRLKTEANTLAIAEIKNNEIKTLQTNKADKELVYTLQTSLARVENKLDALILVVKK